MHQYILGILTKLGYPGLSPRAHALFAQAKTRGKYRWGKKSVLVAGACVIVGLRESKKGVMISQLAVRATITLIISIPDCLDLVSNGRLAARVMSGFHTNLHTFKSSSTAF